MLLTIDVGNTHTVMGIWKRQESAKSAENGNSKSAESAELGNSEITENSKAANSKNTNTVPDSKSANPATPNNFHWEEVRAWRLTTVKSATAEEISMSLNMLFSQHNLEKKEIDGAIMCSVVPRLTANWSVAVNSVLNVSLEMCTASSLAEKFACSYPLPHEIGMDYIADALGALHIYGAPVVVFDFGTATNVSIINKQGVFQGGIIAPGVETGAAALFSKATQLTSVALNVPEHVIGQSTDECIRSGVVFGEAARVDGLASMIFEELGCSATVVATGGLAQAVSARSKAIDYVNPYLTLQGLCVAFDALQDK